MLAVHVDDVRFVVSKEGEEVVWPKLKGLFSFGDWTHPSQFTRFCGRYTRSRKTTGR